MVCHDGPQEYLASEDIDAHLLLGYQLVDKGQNTTRGKKNMLRVESQDVDL